MGKHNIKSVKHLNFVRSCPCIVCMNEGLGETPANAHHLTRNPWTGLTNGISQKSDDWVVIPLCELHHQGNMVGYTQSKHVALHKDIKAFEERYGTEKELFFQFIEEYNIKLPDEYYKLNSNLLNQNNM
jgi:hypothetical protein